MTSENRLLRPPSLSEQVGNRLIARIKTGDYPAGSQLPPENALAEDFKVSRATIRSAIRTLASRGLVVRRQGAGTFVSRIPLIAHSLNQIIDFNELIASNGYTSSWKFEEIFLATPDQIIANHLNIQPQEQAVHLRKTFFADGVPVIYLVDVLSPVILTPEVQQEILERPSDTEPLFTFLQEACEQRFAYAYTTIQPDIARNCPLPAGKYPSDTPVLVLHEVGFNEVEMPLFCSVEYFPGNKITFSVVRQYGMVVD
jgi:GntR family transcriptional regulator